MHVITYHIGVGLKFSFGGGRKGGGGTAYQKGCTVGGTCPNAPEFLHLLHMGVFIEGEGHGRGCTTCMHMPPVPKPLSLGMVIVVSLQNLILKSLIAHVQIV